MKEKDNTVFELIERLKLKINFTLFKVVDYWEADLCAIGLQRGKRLVYISTVNYISKNNERYDFDLEMIDEESKDKLNVVKEGRNVTEAELLQEVKLFLDV